MSDRVKDTTVSDWLAWARNFEEIVAYRVGAGSRRRFRVRIPAGVTRDGHPFRPKEGLLDIMGHTAADVVPPELAFTAREALAFAMGCATARAAALAGSDREWLAEWPQEAREAFVERREEARAADKADMEREMQEREEARQRRMEAYKRRKAGQGQINA